MSEILIGADGGWVKHGSSTVLEVVILEIPIYPDGCSSLYCYLDTDLHRNS